jgi:glycosyltransferase involved in cell wall biosynthesis
MAWSRTPFAPSIAIGVYARSDPELLNATLSSLSANTGRGSTLLLLGDGPDAQTAATLDAQHNLQQSNTDSPRGVAACFNRLTHALRADVYILVEGGARVAPNWLEAMLTAIELYPRCGLVGPSTNVCWNEQAIFPGSGATAGDISRTAVIAARRFGSTCRTLEPLHSLADFCYLVRREVVETIGDADESYGTGPCWEMDYNIRAFRAGFRGYWACAAYVHRAQFAPTREAEQAAGFQASRQLYQDKFCGARLRGQKADYREHCRGSACANFAPADLIAIRHPRLERPANVPSQIRPSAPAFPLVSCIMPTYNRREFVPRALERFLAQDYPNLELLIVDDGTDTVSDLMPTDPRIRYWRLPQRRSVGEKRNYACGEARGEYIVHWDDDDWYCSNRVSRQVRPFLDGTAQISGSSTIYYYDRNKRQAFRYQFTSNRTWVSGNTLAYRRSLWERNAFEALQVGEDTRFVGRIPSNLIHDLRDPTLCIASIHPGNVSPKVASGPFWSPEAVSRIEALLRAGAPDGASSREASRVTCIMPTYNRRAFLPLSLACFQSQTYSNKELVVVDDGSDAIGDLVESVADAGYVRLDRRLSIGAKRNLACERATGDIIAHWDDDDWYSPQRLQQQVEPLLAATHDLTGLVNSFVLEMPSGQFWSTDGSVHKRMFVGDLHGGTLVYLRALWLEGIRYPEVNLAEDAAFIRTACARGKRILRLPNDGQFIYLRHGRNSWKFECGRFLDPAGWRAVSGPPGFRPDVLQAYRQAALQTA